MSTSLPALMTRRRQIPGSRVFDTSKVLADYNPTDKTPGSYYRQTFNHSAEGTTHVPKAGIVSKPDPKHVCFLYENPRFINEPICLANTASIRENQHQWWPQKISEDVKPSPQYDSTSSTNRSDYTATGPPANPRLTRFGCNPYRGEPSRGIVPVNAETGGSTMQEKLSYEHQFDCRKDRTERGKLKGSFVWKEMGGRQLQDKILRRMVNNNNYKCNEWYYHL